MTGQQLDLFHSLGLGGPDSGTDSPVETVQTPDEARNSPASPSRSGATCDHCGSSVDVMFGTCAECFAAWKAAA